ncbi:serine hydrolase [Cryptosporangium aurantiacum]|uniref:Beta-lactamase enzyme family protein n=1 Tax=Cryptosporangium aurantiacum TaxID=134849 RepID=A0A1M7JJ51_9ACTN|nr:serine hydrolase [Cryptosporangium aurantiacum]SHM53008.1 Beta-lactamase enzyme family protein [Cryptosporangium aurantiacum]
MHRTRRLVPAIAAMVAGAVLAAGTVSACQADQKPEPEQSAAAPVVPAAPTPTPLPSAAPGTAGPDAERSAWLGEQLREIVDAQHFDDVVNAKTGKRPPAMPNVDVAVIELDDTGRPVAAANTLLTQKHPHGVAVPVTRDLSAPGVRWTHWSNSVWAAKKSTEPLLADRGDAPLEFMTPYPASVFKLIVAFGVARLADRGGVRYDEVYDYRPRKATCPDGRKPGKHSVSWWLDAMLTYSSNTATCALLMMLHERDGVAPMNGALRSLGLPTLRVVNTDPADGGGWSFWGLTMTALDTSRLLLLFTEAPGTLWRTPKGDPVTVGVLKRSSRATLRKMLRDQGLNQALSTANWCGQDYPAQGIPHAVPKRWIDPATGVVHVEDRTYRGDVRKCADDAEVEFAHKTGLVPSAGADAGIVTALPGAKPRRYVISVFSNLGCTYVDFVGAYDGACRYTEKLATLGAAVDALMTKTAGRATATLVSGG